MNNSLTQRLVLPLAIPTAFLSFAWLLLPYRTLLPASLTGLMDYGPYLLLAVLITLGITHNRLKIVLTSVLLATAWFIFNQQQGPNYNSMEQASLLDLALKGVIPLNLALISTLFEKGIFSRHASLRYIFLLAQAGLFVALFYFPDVLMSVITQQTRMQIMHYPFLESLYQFSPTLQGLALTHLNQTLLLVSTIVIIGSAYYRNNYLSFGLLGTFAGYTMGVLLPDTDKLLAVNLIAGSMLLFVALLRDSHNMAYRDELTGLRQRRALNEQLMSLGSHYTLAMLDVDHFKKFNDTHGHDIGDQILQMVASRIGKVRGGGKAFRYGGEEFAVVFSTTDVKDACYHLDEVRKTIQNYEMVIRDTERPEDPGKQKRSLRHRGSYRAATKKVSVTISVGVAAKELRSELPEEVLKKADQALYKAKQSGRNQVVTHSGD